MLQYKLGHHVTVIKLTPQGEEKVRYPGCIVEHLASGIVLLANWTLPMQDLGYTRFEPQDQFREYYYTDRWFNIFSISSAIGTHKGWYCNIAEPVQLGRDYIWQVDLLLDVWVNPAGEPLLLDEDEFALAILSERQKTGARQGLQMLLQMLEARQEVFSSLAPL
jgi:protein associated with RNAse G/E